MAARTFTQYLLDVSKSGAPHHEYAPILSAVAVSVKLIAAMVSRGALILGPSPHLRRPTSREVNRKLRKLATEILVAQTEDIEQLAAISLADHPSVLPVCADGRYLLVFEAL
ncbi:MAG: hypothetical protein WAL91_06440, partial [Propionicimonas sp.]